MDTCRPKLQPFTKKAYQTTGVASLPASQESTFPFVPLLFKPQDGAVAPFQTNQPTRQPEARSSS
jgi:hypothetical protein